MKPFCSYMACGSTHAEPRQSLSEGIVSYLVRQRVGTEVTQRKLEPPVAAFDVDLEGHQGVWVRS